MINKNGPSQGRKISNQKVFFHYMKLYIHSKYKNILMNTLCYYIIMHTINNTFFY